MPFKNFKIVEEKTRNQITGKNEVGLRRIPIDSRDKEGKLVDFTGGFGWNLYYDEPPTLLPGWNLREIFPTIKNESDQKIATLPLVHNSIRSIELMKEPGDDLVHIFVGGVDIDSENLAKTLQVDSTPSEKTKPDWLTKSKLSEFEIQGYPDPVCFDIERSHCLDFSPIDTLGRQSSIINELVRACSEKESGIWIQMVFSGGIDWTRFCELSTNNLAMKLRKIEDGIEKTNWSISVAGKIPIPTSTKTKEKNFRELSSTVYVTGSKIIPFYVSRIHSSPVVLSIRGMILDKDDSTIKSISSVFSNLRFIEDVLSIHQYEDLGGFFQWMISRNITGLYGVKSLIDNCNMWVDTTWGRSEKNPNGRDLVPFLCVTSSELNYFVDVPDDVSLKIQTHRQHVPGLSSQKIGFLMGDFV